MGAICQSSRFTVSRVITPSKGNSVVVGHILWTRNSGLVHIAEGFVKKHDKKGGFDLLPALPPPSELSVPFPYGKRPNSIELPCFYLRHSVNDRKSVPLVSLSDVHYSSRRSYLLVLISHRKNRTRKSHNPFRVVEEPPELI